MDRSGAGRALLALAVKIIYLMSVPLVLNGEGNGERANELAGSMPE